MIDGGARSSWSIGSEWRRWDLHVHPHGTGAADQYTSWESFIAGVEAAPQEVIAVGVTDYCSISRYTKVLDEVKAGRMKNIRLFIPNIEFRIFPYGNKGRAINIHLIVDPTDGDHVARIIDALTRLTFTYDDSPFPCTDDGLTRLGAAFDSKLSGEAARLAGVNQFKTDFTRLKGWLQGEKWLRNRTLVAVAASSNDGTGSLQEGGFEATRREIQRFADIIFSGTPGDRTYWAGLGADSEEKLREMYGALKPVLHGSDAHTEERLFKPRENRYCWIRAEPTFSGLRQTLYEPVDRVWIGESPPLGAPAEETLRKVRFHGTEGWLSNSEVTLNAGLVAVVGPRGSGKTALADLVAAAAGDAQRGRASFLRKAGELVDGQSVEAFVGQSSLGLRSLAESPFGDDDAEPKSVRYLSQQFVEQLCSEDNVSAGLRDEIARVVFENLPEEDRLGASSFEELRKARASVLWGQRTDAQAEITAATKQIDEIQRRHESLPAKRTRLSRLDTEITALGTELTKLLANVGADQAKAFQDIQNKFNDATTRVTELKKQQQGLLSLQANADRLTKELSRFGQSLTDEWMRLGFESKEVSSVVFEIPDGVTRLMKDRLEEVQAKLRAEDVTEGSPESFASIKARSDALATQLSDDNAKRDRAAECQKQITQKGQERGSLQDEIAAIEKANSATRKELTKARLDSYISVFDTIQQEKDLLVSLHAPLSARVLRDEEKLEFYVRCRADIADWARRGEDLIDLRKKGSFSEPGALAKEAEARVGAAWRASDKERVRAGMLALLEQFRDVKERLRSGKTTREFAEWLFSVDHISIEYGLRYNGIDLGKLSPGTKGVVLLLLYLVIDNGDRRPLIIDQPEENLDPRSVFDILVRYFRQARKLRQVIIVTHNPNLVVNTDADQVIVANANPRGDGVLPAVSYTAGALEDDRIRAQVCSILEGGQRAFQERERRYRLPPRLLAEPAESEV